MNEKTTVFGGGALSEEEQVRRLVEEAGPRPEVPAEDLMAIKAAFRAAWQQHVERPRSRPLPRWQLVALAAALVLAVLGLGGWWWSLRAPAGPAALAEVLAIEGEVGFKPPGETGEPVAPLAAGQALAAGAELATGNEERPGRVALRMAGGGSVRLNAGSRLQLVSATVLRLAQGAVYVDSGGSPGGAIAVHTSLGVARPIGTRFEVRLLPADSGSMRVQVRQGTVLLERGQESYRAAAGEALTLRADGSVARETIDPYGVPWSWVLETAPPFDIEGRTLAEFLDWVAAETGWEIRLDDSAASAAGETLHGTYGEATPEEALGIVLKGAGLAHELTDGVVIIRAGD